MAIETRAYAQNELSVRSSEFTQSGFHRYAIALPLPHREAVPLPLDRVTLTVWSEQPLQISNRQDFINAVNANGTLPIVMGCGLLSHPGQFDRDGNSFVRTLTDTLRSSARDQVNPLYIGMSCPGFTGSEITKPIVTPEDVSVNTYTHLLEEVIAEIGLPAKKAAIIGHSAGGALVHQYAHEHPEDLRLKVALHPAIHVKPAGQFLAIDTLDSLKSLLMLRPLERGAAEEVVRYLLGVPLIGKLNPQEKAQVDMHVNELIVNREGAKAKLKELNDPLVRGEQTILSTLTITGTKDRITPFKQMRYGFPDEWAGFTKLESHHDDVFIRPDIQQEVAQQIATYLLGQWRML